MCNTHANIIEHHFQTWYTTKDTKNHTNRQEISTLEAQIIRGLRNGTERTRTGRGRMASDPDRITHTRAKSGLSVKYTIKVKTDTKIWDRLISAVDRIFSADGRIFWVKHRLFSTHIRVFSARTVCFTSQDRIFSLEWSWVKTHGPWIKSKRSFCGNNTDRNLSQIEDRIFSVVQSKKIPRHHKSTRKIHLKSFPKLNLNLHIFN